VAVQRYQRRAGVIADAAGGQRAVAKIFVVLQIGNHQHVAAVGDVAARGAQPRNGHVLDADARLEPLPVAVCQRDRRYRQIEQARGHAGDAVEGFTGSGVQQVQFIERIESARFVDLARCGHGAVSG
jgi:hypothetical protein